MLPHTQHWHKPQPFKEQVQQLFQQGEALLFICATGIVVRTLAPVLTNKYQDPAVLVCDEQGQFIIPLLSGHEGGANEKAQQLAQLLGATCVMTTAQAYTHPVYTLGMGCERGCDQAHLKTLAEACLTQKSLSWDQVAGIYSIDLKQDEVGLIELAAQLNKPFLTYSPQILRTVESQLSQRSDYVFKVTGVYGVAESAALYAAQTITKSTSELILNKHKTAKATCAIARSYYPKPLTS